MAGSARKDSKVTGEHTAGNGNVATEYSSAGIVKGKQIVMRQATAQTVEADEIEIRQGAAVRIQADELEMTQGGALVITCESAELEASTAAIILSGGNVTMDQSGAKVVLARGDIVMDQSGSLITAGRNVKADRCGSFLVLAGKVEGNLNTKFGPRESLLFGAAAGLAAGFSYALARLLFSRSND
jgi:hypothetical protein